MSCLSIDHILFLESPFPTIVGIISQSSAELSDTLTEIQKNGNEMLIYDLNNNKIKSSSKTIKNIRFLAVPAEIDNLRNLYTDLFNSAISPIMSYNACKGVFDFKQKNIKKSYQSPNPIESSKIEKVHLTTFMNNLRNVYHKY